MSPAAIEPSAFPHGPTTRRLPPPSNLPDGVLCSVIDPGQPGMTLRDYFAAAALAALALKLLDRIGPEAVAGIAGSCYRIADEMLAFRSAAAHAPRG